MTDELERLRELTAEQPDLQMVMGALESLSDPVVIVEPDGYTIVYVNQQAEFVFGYKREDLKGKHINLLIPESRQKAHSEHLEEFRNHPHARSMMGGTELEARRQNGTQFKCLVKIEPYSTDYGRYVSAQVRVL